MAGEKYFQLRAGWSAGLCVLALARAFAVTVHSEMFGRRRHCVVLLHSFDHLHAETGNQIRVFTVSIFHTPPTLIARRIQSRSVNIRVAQRPALDAGDASHLTR